MKALSYLKSLSLLFLLFCAAERLFAYETIISVPLRNRIEYAYDIFITAENLPDTVKKSEVKKTLLSKLKIDSIQNPEKSLKGYGDKKITELGLKGLLKKDSIPDKKKIKLEGFGFENSVAYATPSLNANNSFQNNFSVSGTLTLYNLPLNLDFANIFNSVRSFNPAEGNLFRFDLAKDKLQSAFKSDLDNYAKLKKASFQGMDVSSYLKKAITAKLSKLQAGNIKSNPALSLLMNNPDELTGLLSLNKEQFRNKLEGVLKQKESAVISQFTTKADSIKGIAGLEMAKQVNEISSLVTSVKKQLDANGLDEAKIRLIQKFLSKDGNVKDLSDVMVAELAKKPEFKGIAKFYSQIRDLQAGSFGQQIPGNLLNNELFIKGFNFSVNTRRGPATIGLGVNKDTGLPKDALFTSSVFSTPRAITYLTAPTNRYAYGNGSISFVNMSDKQFSGLTYQGGVLPKNTMTFTVSQNVTTASFGKLTIDVSKSASQYSNSLLPGNEQVLMEKSALGNYFRDDLFQTLSVALNQDISMKKQGVSGSLFFNYSGIGFQNPGQPGAFGMGSRYGANLKKNFLKNKLIFNVRSAVRNTPISFENNDKWSNYQVQIDSRYKMNRNYNFSLKYLESGTDKISTVSANVFATRKLQGEMNANFKIAGLRNFSHINISGQKMSSPLSALASDFIMLNYSHNLLFNDFSISASLFCNKETNAVKIMGDMINSDLGCNFTLFRKIALTTAVTYLDNEDIARQAGLRQNIQFSAGKNFDFGAFLDIRKDLITSVYPMLYPASRGELSLKYYLNK